MSTLCVCVCVFHHLPFFIHIVFFFFLLFLLSVADAFMFLYFSVFFAFTVQLVRQSVSFQAPRVMRSLLCVRGKLRVSSERWGRGLYHLGTNHVWLRVQYSLCNNLGRFSIGESIATVSCLTGEDLPVLWPTELKWTDIRSVNRRYLSRERSAESNCRLGEFGEWTKFISWCR